MDASVARPGGAISRFRAATLPPFTYAMRSLSLIQLKKRSLGLMWLMFGVYAWLSSVVQLDHTDDLRAIHRTQSALCPMALAAPVCSVNSMTPPACSAKLGRKAVHAAPSSAVRRVRVDHFRTHSQYAIA